MRNKHGSESADFRGRLPPLPAIETFVAAARAGTFSSAARELGVTQSAVSRQIQQLEHALGTTLFLRHKRGLRLTSDGELLLPAAAEAFARLAEACDALRTVNQVLTLRMPPTLATRWFLPLLAAIPVTLADVDVRLATYEAYEPGFDNNDIDAAIVHGRGDWPDVEAIALMPERLTPVCTPALAQRLRTPEDLRAVPLLHCAPVSSWSQWFELVGLAGVDARRGQRFDTLELSLSAATRGQGVALGDLSLMHESLRDGVLVAPFEPVLDLGVGYFLVYPPGRTQLPKIRALRQWLLAAAGTAG